MLILRDTAKPSRPLSRCNIFMKGINPTKKYRWTVLTGGVGIAAALLLHAARTDGMNVMTGSKAFTNTASISPGLARKITAQDLPQPQPPGGVRAFRMMLSVPFSGGTRPESAI